MPLVTNFQEEYFYSLVNIRVQRKSRFCLKCHIQFESSGSAHRICGVCAAANQRVGARAQEWLIAPSMV